MKAVSCAALSALMAALIACSPGETTAGGAKGARREVVSTLDQRVQLIAREEIARAVGEWKPTAAFVVVLDPAAGAILAMEGYDRGRDEPTLASRRTFVTGSTLKTITIAAALDAGTIDLGTHVDCATRFYGAEKLTDAAQHGSLSVSEVLAVSSNVGVSRIYDTLGLDRLLGTMRRFHFGEPPAALPDVSDGGGINAAMLASGELAKATPLQVAAAYGAIFNDGLYIAPTLTKTTSPPERVLRSATAATMVTMLEMAVASNLGLGKRARIEGATVAGKSGTADLGDERDYASFVGTVLDRQPRLVVLVGLEAPLGDGTGPSAAAPTFARIARRLISR